MSRFEKFKNSGVLRALRAAKYSWDGFLAAWRYESAFRQEIVLFVILLPLALWVGETGVERALLSGSMFLVLVIEMINSALEAAIDRHGEEIHPLSKQAKDMGSAAVFLAMCNVVMIWILVILEKAV